MSIFDNSLNRPNNAWEVDSYGFNDNFSIPNLLPEEEVKHKITTDHPFMVALGLQTFNTGILYRWWNEKDGEGNYVNHKFFAEDPENDIKDKTHPILLLLGEETSREDHGDKSTEVGENQFSYFGWRTSQVTANKTAGTYTKQYIDGGHTEEWSITRIGEDEAGNPKAYSYSDLEIDEFVDQARYNSVDVNIWGYSLFHTNRFFVPDGKGGSDLVKFKGISPITDVVNLNDYSNHIQLTDIEKIDWDVKKFARVAFATDMQFSKKIGGSRGFVEWSGLVPFHIKYKAEPSVVDKEKNPDAEQEEVLSCLKYDWVKYKMYLDGPGGGGNERSLALANPVFVAPRKNYAGVKYGFEQDGRYSAFPEGSEVAKVAAELDMTYNENLGKWESGSPQMIGIVTQNIPAANALSVRQLRELTNEEMLRKPSDATAHFLFGSGACMPLSQKNGNQKQWTPNYAKPSTVDSNGRFVPDCDEGDLDKEKHVMTVFNASTAEYEVDQMVLLNRIDGQWFVIDFPSGVDQATEFDPGFKGKWDFTYLATNKAHFHRTKTSAITNPKKIEDAYYLDFYKDHNVVKFSSYYKSIQLTLEEFNLSKLIPGPVHQFSSFDFMDRKFGGTRDQGIAYSTINNDFGPDGNQIGGDFDGENTTVFFGCTFPDGYRLVGDENYEDLLVDRSYDIESTVAVSGYDDEYKSFISKANNGSWTGPKGSAAYAYFNGPTVEDPDTIAIKKEDRPFDGEGRNDCNSPVRDDDGEIIPMLFTGDNHKKHIPADILLNASPSGLNGQPIRNAYLLDMLYNQGYGLDGEGNMSELGEGDTRSPFERAQDYFRQAPCWLFKKYAAGTKGDKGFLEESAFDFKPVRSNRIKFRPLKFEAFAQFNWNVYFADYYGQDWDSNKAVPAEAEGQGLGGINPNGYARQNAAFEACFTTISATRPASDMSFSRTLDHQSAAAVGYSAFGFVHDTVDGSTVTKTQAIPGHLYPMIHSEWGLLYNPDITAVGHLMYDFGDGFASVAKMHPHYDENGVGILGSDKYGGGKRHFRVDCWGHDSNGWCHGGYPVERKDTILTAPIPSGPNWPWRKPGNTSPPLYNNGDREDTREAGGIGLIGTICRAGAESSISIDVDSKLGCWSWAIPPTLGQEGVNNFLAWDGRFNTNLHDTSTTLAFAKIMQAWPRECTVFDVQNFAVHHFNPGIHAFDADGNPNKNLTEKDISQIYLKDGADKHEYVKFKYQIENDLFHVDTKIPTRVKVDPSEDETVLNFPEPLEANSLCFGKSAYSVFPFGTDDPDIGWIKTLNYADWNLSYDRRGQLLPFFYKMTSMVGRYIGVELPEWDSDHEEYGEKGGVNWNYGGVIISIDDDETFASSAFPNATWYPFFDSRKDEGEDGFFVSYSPIEDTVVPDPFNLGETTTVEGRSLAMVVRDPGLGYAVDDTLTVDETFGFNYEILIDDVDDNGRVKAFTVSDTGADFDNRYLVPSGGSITRANDGGGTMVFKNKDSSAGEGFDGFLVSLVNSTRMELSKQTGRQSPPHFNPIQSEDEKPKVAHDVDEFRLLSRGVTDTQKDEPFGLITNNETFNFDIDNPATGTAHIDLGLYQQYDIFIRAQNDIGHTFKSNETINSVSRWQNDEQHFEFTINIDDK